NLLVSVLIIGSFIFFRVLQYVVRWYLFGKCTFRAFSYFGLSGRNRNSDSSRDLTVIPPNKKWRISNESVSLFHSVVSGMWAAYCLLFYKSLTDDLINDRTRIAINLIFVSFGYLLHDFLDLVLNEQSARIIELLFHHVVVITGFVITLIMQITVIPWVHCIFCIFVIFSLFCSNAVLTYRVMAADGLFGAARARKPPLAPVACASVTVETGDRNGAEADDDDDEDVHEVAVQTTDARILVDDPSYDQVEVHSKQR
ncbi:hypothetical protein TELCIR_03296, partial [Teladorsagia circumcincta]